MYFVVFVLKYYIVINHNTKAMTLKRQTQMSFIATLIMMAIMRYQGKMLSDKGYNIIKFELAKTVNCAQKIMEAWSTEGVAIAQINTYIDFVFILAYASLGYFGSLALTQKNENWSIRQLGQWMAKGMLVAGILDSIENIAMLRTLSGSVVAQNIWIAYGCAAVKFTIILFVIIVALFVLAHSFIKKKPSLK